MHRGVEITNLQKDWFIQNYKSEINSKDLVSSFDELLMEKTGINTIISELESQYGVKVKIASFSKTNDGSTFGLSGLKNIVISPKILKQMETNPKLKERIFNDVKKLVNPVWDMETKTFIRMAGLVERNRGIIVHDDGTVSWFGNTEQTEEEKELVEQLKRNKEKNAVTALFLPLVDNLYELSTNGNAKTFETNPYLLSMIGSELLDKKKNKSKR